AIGLGGALVGGVGARAPGATAAPAPGGDIVCEAKDVCRMVKTRLPLRVLPRVNSSIYQAKDARSPVVEADVPAFIPLYVFERIDVSYADPIRPTGWFRVGKDKDNAIGYMPADAPLEWNTPLAPSSTHRGP